MKPVAANSAAVNSLVPPKRINLASGTDLHYLGSSTDSAGEPIFGGMDQVSPIRDAENRVKGPPINNFPGTRTSDTDKNQTSGVSF